MVIGNGYMGCNISYGPGVAPFEAHAELTYSILINIGNVNNDRDEIIKALKETYDKLSEEQKDSLYKNFGIDAKAFE